MKIPEGLDCPQCEHYWWYIDSCRSLHKKCNRFKIKTKSEDPWYDPLPTPEQLEIFQKVARL